MNDDVAHKNNNYFNFTIEIIITMIDYKLIKTAQYLNFLSRLSILCISIFNTVKKLTS
jgi:hypothetical protein